MSTARDRRSTARLSLVPLPPTASSGPPATDATSAWTARRPAVLRLCAGEALHLEDREVDFVDLVNRTDRREAPSSATGAPGGRQVYRAVSATDSSSTRKNW